MSLYGIGTDLVQVARMEKLHARHGQRILDKLMSAEEQREFKRRKKAPAAALASAFAVKEAFVKALGTGFRGVGYTDVGLLRKTSGQPELCYSPKLKALLKKRGVGAAQVSLSDEGGFVLAFVCLERADKA